MWWDAKKQRSSPLRVNGRKPLVGHSGYVRSMMSGQVPTVVLVVYVGNAGTAARNVRRLGHANHGDLFIPVGKEGELKAPDKDQLQTKRPRLGWRGLFVSRSVLSRAKTPGP